MSGGVPGAVPAPAQTVQTTAVSTLISRVTPNAASASSRLIRISASWPRRVRGRGPRVPACWPKNASMMSVNEKPWPKPGPGAGAGQRVAAEVVHLALLRVADSTS